VVSEHGKVVGTVRISIQPGQFWVRYTDVRKSLNVMASYIVARDPHCAGQIAQDTAIGASASSDSLERYVSFDESDSTSEVGTAPVDGSVESGGNPDETVAADEDKEDESAHAEVEAAPANKVATAPSSPPKFEKYALSKQFGEKVSP
jgi:hypothetical protein